MSKKKSFSQTKRKVSNAIQQAKESLKILETLERESFAKIRSLFKIPTPEERKRITNERILASLRRIGVATQSDLDRLNAKVERLEFALEARTKSSNSHRSTFLHPSTTEIEN
jgi:hypothetical protein